MNGYTEEAVEAMLAELDALTAPDAVPIESTVTPPPEAPSTSATKSDAHSRLSPSVAAAPDPSYNEREAAQVAPETIALDCNAGTLTAAAVGVAASRRQDVSHPGPGGAVTAEQNDDFEVKMPAAPKDYANLMVSVAANSSVQPGLSEAEMERVLELMSDLDLDTEVVVDPNMNADSCPSRPPLRDDVARRNGMMSPTITR
jgi:hypothetical protein